MVQKINRLPEEVINKIAAGEVVENPASIAKELIENSLDAGALHIDISIDGGGCKLLQIEDDGCGMDSVDALLSLERHATSKIRSEQDLFSLFTMGFRGEALAAVASVSRLEMRTSDGGPATQIQTEGGEIFATLPCARNRGTTVAVRDLFFNVPARKKFLKSASANTAALTRCVETIALAHPEIAFTLKSDGRIVLQLFPEEKKKRIENVLSPMQSVVDAPGLWGLLASSVEAKVHRRGQYLFINKRPIFSPLISRAVKAGYGTRIAETSHPSFVLFLEIAPDLVDVNVHPQKKEVRFAEEGKIFRMVEKAVARAFESPAPVFSRTLAFPQVPFSFAEDPAPPPLNIPHTPLSFDFPFSERPLAVVDGYLFLQAEGLLLIDLRLAYARVLYEALKEKKDTAQTLLWPIEAAIDEIGIVEELQAMGIECRLIGKRTLAVDALPSLMNPEDFPDFLNAWRNGKKLDAAITHASRSAKRKFTVDEAFLLWRQLLKCRETVYDPSGRRIWDRVDGERLKKLLENP
jgi:DNA mismatch repair protein MutL